MSEHSLPRYQRLADELAAAMAAGLLRAGERLPSVRESCRLHGISPATVFQAYARLEAEGLIEARPRSGYYVRAPRRPRTAPLPAPASARSEAQPVALSELAFALLASATDPELVPLGSAFPASRLFPFAQLARAGARAMRHLPPESITSAQLAGDPELRQALRRRYALHGVALGEQELVITNGAMEALNLCLQAVTKPGDVVAVESPTFYAGLQALQRQQLRAIELPTHPEEGLDLQALEALLQRAPPQDRPVACWFMGSFQNPLGALMPAPRKQALVQLLTRERVALIEDDVYAELYAGGQRPPPAKAFDSEGYVLHCGSFSKCLAPGYRVGWAAAGRYADRLLRLKGMASLASSLPAQRAIAEYLAEGGFERHLRRLRAALAAGRQRCLKLIERHFPAGTRVTRPEGGYFLWLQLPPAVDALQLHEQAMARGISSAPGLLFSADGRFRHHLRLNVGHPEDRRVEAALRELGALACARFKTDP